MRRLQRVCGSVPLVLLLPVVLTACHSHAGWELNRGNDYPTAVMDNDSIKKVNQAGVTEAVVEEVAEPPGDVRPGIDPIHLGDDRAVVFSRLADSDSVIDLEQHCQTQKLAMRDSRRAFILESCEVDITDGSLHDMSVTRLDVHLLEDTLVRIDLELVGNDADFSALIMAMTEIYGAPDASDTRPGQPKLHARWHQADDVLDLREQEASTGVRATLNLIDGQVADRLTALWPD